MRMILEGKHEGRDYVVGVLAVVLAVTLFATWHGWSDDENLNERPSEGGVAQAGSFNGAVTHQSTNPESRPVECAKRCSESRSEAVEGHAVPLVDVGGEEALAGTGAFWRASRQAQTALPLFTESAERMARSLNCGLWSACYARIGRAETTFLLRSNPAEGTGQYHWLATASRGVEKKATTAEPEVGFGGRIFSHDSPEAEQVRDLLRDLGLYSHGISSSEAESLIGAVLLWQAANGLPLTGKIDEALLQALSEPRIHAIKVSERPLHVPPASRRSVRTALANP